jgi:hypothetical protein
VPLGQERTAVSTPHDPFRTPDGNDGQGHGASPYGEQPPAGQGHGGQGYGNPEYGGQPYGAAPYGDPGAFGGSPSPRNGLGVAALVLGILGLVSSLFVVGGLLGLVAIVLGVLGRGRAKRREATNGGMALAGILTGAVAVVLSALVLAGVASLFNQADFGSFTECLEQAGGDQAAVEQCQRDFEDRVTGG